MSGKRNLGKARGLNSIADPSEFKGKAGRPPKKPQDKPSESPENTQENLESAPETPESTPVDEIDLRDAATSEDPVGPSEAPAKKRRGRPPATGSRRIRRELSVPVVVADAVEQTGMNPADLVMNAYRRHSDGVYTGEGARLAARGRKRLRISLSDGDLDKITRLGEARNWNRSETVSVLLALDLLVADSGAN